MDTVTLDYANAPRYAKSREVYRAACEVIPGGVNSTARATWSGWDPYPLFVERARARASATSTAMTISTICWVWGR